MAMTQFAMVEELASLVKDNLFCKHLVLSTEEAFINFLQDNTSVEGVLELQPMSPYHRLLLHRLADIYGFAHESVGEGDDRHLVLERCPETAIPPILVGDILWQYDEYQSPASPQHILRRKETAATKTAEAMLSSTSLKEREAAYLAARERIFSLHRVDEKEVVAPKSRNVPVVARRMIAHALGKQICSESSNHELSVQKCEANEATEVPNNGDKNDNHALPTAETNEKTSGPKMKLSSHERKAYGKPVGRSSCAHNKTANSSSSSGNMLVNERNGRMVGNENLEREQIGAAKRIFAHALGLSSSKRNQGLAVKPNGGKSFSNKMCRN